MSHLMISFLLDIEKRDLMCVVIYVASNILLGTAYLIAQVVLPSKRAFRV